MLELSHQRNNKIIRSIILIGVILSLFASSIITSSALAQSGTILEVRVSASSDDAEEKSSGNVGITSTDLEFVYDGSDQIVGMRFNEIAIPQGALITSAYIQFQVDEINSEATNLIIEGEDVDNAVTFTTTSGSISSRPRTSAAVAWSPNPWITVGEAGPDQQTPDIASVIQEIVIRDGWTSGNSLVILISGTGERTAESYDGTSSAAPLLHVEYSQGGNLSPFASISSPANGSTFNEGNSVTFTGIGNDFEDGDLTSSLSWTSNIDGNIGSGGSFTLSDLSIGVHRITAIVMDSNGQIDSDTTTITVFAITPVLVGAGDIAYDGPRDEETAKLLETISGTVFTLGDNTYPYGTEAEFSNYYDPTWGRHKARTFPSVGNHDYDTSGALPYYNYFGAAAGDPTKGYYSYDVGDWHIIVLNSNCNDIGGCTLSSPQGQWLQADLAANPKECTLAYWHHPLFSSTSSLATTRSQDFWSLLYESNADVILNGHTHNYERFAPQDPNGLADPQGGIREFVVGTGGAEFHTFDTVAANSEVRNVGTAGVLKLSLQSTSYSWEFIPVAGSTFTDSGSANCVPSSSINHTPVAINDNYSIAEGTMLTVNAPGVLGNDSDTDGDPLTALIDIGPSNGSLSLNGDGSFTYTPDANFTGPDSFTYHANDGTADSNSATVSITVNEINSAPTATYDNYITDEDTLLSVVAPGVLSNDSDTDGDPLTVALVSDASNGSLTLNADGSFNYTPIVDFNGSESFTYKANDGVADSNVVTVTITVNPVNDKPLAVDDTGTLFQGGTLNVPAPGLLGNDSDPDYDILTITTTPVSAPMNGNLTLNPDGSYSYTHNGSETTSDSFIYAVCDSESLCDTATVTLTITATNTPPVAMEDSYTTDEASTLNVNAPGVLSNDGDTDGDPLTATIDTGPSNGSLTLNGDGSFTYTPDANFIGLDSFTYHANDGTADSNSATVSITVNKVNSAPTATDDNYITDENTPLNVVAPGVLGNDGDADGDLLTATIDTGPSNGSLTLNGDGSFTYTPDANFTGPDSFTYYANDGVANSTVAIVTISVNPVESTVDSLATSETSVAGTLSGSYLDTHLDDGIAESIAEQESGGKPSKRYSYLEHKWIFNVTSGNVVTLYANTWTSGSSDGDSFVFAYSMDDSEYTEMFTVNSTSVDSLITYTLPSSVQGTVYVRVTDSNRTSGNLNLDSIFVDHLYIHSETQPGSPPATPSMLNASAISSSQINLSWTDISFDESGLYIERSEDNSNWTLIDTVDANVTSYVDTTVFPSTTYYYRIQAYNFSGSSSYSNTATVTTPAGLYLTGSGYKVKGVQAVDLSWNGSNATSFEIYRDGNLIAVGVSGVAYTDNIGLKGNGVYQYQVCETGSLTNCSNIVQIIF